MTGNMKSMLASLLAALQQTRAGQNLVKLNYHNDRTGEWVEIVEKTDDGGVRTRDINVTANSGAAIILAVVKEVI